MDKDADLITHLLEVEQNAYEVTKVAQEDANKKIAQAKADADKEFNEKYMAAVKNIDEEYNKKKATIESAYKQQLDEYKKSIEGVAQHKKEFFAYLKSVA